MAALGLDAPARRHAGLEYLERQSAMSGVDAVRRFAVGAAAQGSSRLAQRSLTKAGDAADADNLPKVALDQVHHIARHASHRDFDMHRVVRAVRPHAIRDQVALGEGLQQARQQAWLDIRIEHEADGFRRFSEHGEKLRTRDDAKGESGYSPAAQAAGRLIRVHVVQRTMRSYYNPAG